MGLFDSPSHLLIVLLVLVLLFGSAKLPRAAKSMGEAMRIFKKETQKLHDEDSPAASNVQPAAPQQLPAPPPVVSPQAQDSPAPASAPLPETPRTNQPG